MRLSWNQEFQLCPAICFRRGDLIVPHGPRFSKNSYTPHFPHKRHWHSVYSPNKDIRSHTESEFLHVNRVVVHYLENELENSGAIPP